MNNIQVTLPLHDRSLTPVMSLCLRLWYLFPDAIHVTVYSDKSRSFSRCLSALSNDHRPLTLPQSPVQGRRYDDLAGQETASHELAVFRHMVLLKLR